ncbi:MAG TPA: hypothetical protein VF499_02575 [Afipia sp.]
MVMGVSPWLNAGSFNAARYQDVPHPKKAGMLSHHRLRRAIMVKKL